MAGGLASRPKDSEWLPEMAQLAQVAVVARHTEAAAVLYELLSPHADRFCVEGIGAAFTGSVQWYLGLLADVLGSRSEAARHEAARGRRIGGSVSSATPRASRLRRRPQLSSHPPTGERSEPC